MIFEGMRNLFYLLLPCMMFISCNHHNNDGVCTCTVSYDPSFGLEDYVYETTCIDCTDDQYDAFVETCSESDGLPNYSCVLD